MMRLWSAIGFLLCLGSAALAQSPGTLNLQGPSNNPAAPPITHVEQLNDAINAALAAKQNYPILSADVTAALAAPPSIGGITPGFVAGLNLPIAVTAPPYNAVCDGSTPDTTAIQNAITAAAGHYRTYVPSGVTCMVGTLSLPSKTIVVIDGTLKLLPATNNSMLKVANGADSVAIVVNGTLDGNKSAQSGGGSGGVANAGTATNVSVSGAGLITNFQNWPINITQTTGSWMSGLRLTNSGNSVEFAQGTSNCWASGLYINGIADISFAFYGGVSSCGISNSIVTGSTLAGGIGVMNDTGQPAIVQDITIANNVVSGHYLSGIAIQKGTGGSGNNARITVAGNRVFGNNTSNSATQADINFAFATESSAVGNMLGPSGNGNQAFYGVLVLSTSDTVSVVGNTITNEGIGGTLGVGVQVSTAPRTIVANNLIRDDGAGTMAFGLNGTPGTANQIVNNAVYGTTGQFNNMTMAADTVYSQSGVNGNIRLQQSRSQRLSYANTIGSGATHTATTNDETIVWASATGGAKAETIPTCAAGNAGQQLRIKDNQGTAGVGNITITPATGTIDGAASLVISTNRGVAKLQCDGVGNWMIM
jgi:hypothetical protein